MARSVRRLASLATALPLAAAAAAQSGEAVTFRVSESLSLSPVQLAHRVLVGDVDTDGNLDVVVAWQPFGESLTLLGVGDGTLGPLQENFGHWGNPALGDLDADGQADLVSVPGNQTDITVSLAGPHAVFGQEVDYFATSTFPNTVVVAPLDADGDLDVAVGFGDFSPAGVSTLAGGGDGTLAFLDSWGVGPNIFSIEAGDLTGDGTAEVFAGESASVIFTAGDGTLAAEYELPVGSSGATAALGDVTGDGLGDVVACWFVGFNHANGTFAGTGGHELAPVVAFTSALRVSERGLGDFDQDGRLDLLGEAPGAVVLAIGAGDGSFVDAQSLVSSPDCFPQSVVADMDGDGVSDAVIDNLCGGTRTLSVHLNAGPVPWKDLGHGLQGVNGLPALAGTGDLAAGSLATLTLGSAAPSAAVALVLGVREGLLPFKGGVLVPTPAAAVLGLATDAAAALVLSVHVPAGMPPGVAIFLQAWIADAVAPQGWSASNGLRAFPP